MSTHIIKFAVSVNIIVVKDGNEYYASCPTFKGVHVPGRTIKNAINNAKEAIGATIFSLLKHNEPIPCCEVLSEDMIPDSMTVKEFKKHLHHENISIDYPSETVSV